MDWVTWRERIIRFLGQVLLGPSFNRIGKTTEPVRIAAAQFSRGA